MFEKIVFATDLSPVWDEIVACAGEFRALGCSKVILTHVITVKFMVGLDTALRMDAEPKLKAQKEILESHGLKVVVEMPTGLPAYSLNEVASCYDASLIVVGTHGKSLWREAVLGSVANALLHNAKFPMLLLNVKLREAEGRGTCRLRCNELLRHVLFLTDFSKVADRASRYLDYLIPKGLSRATILHALSILRKYPSEFLQQEESVARDSFQVLENRLKAAGIPRVESQLSKGHPVSVILQAMRAGDYSMIIMGTQGKSLLSETLLGSVAHDVARLAPCPILLIPRESSCEA